MAVVRYAGFVCADMFVFGELPSQIPNPELFVSTIGTGVGDDPADARIVYAGLLVSPTGNSVIRICDYVID